MILTARMKDEWTKRQQGLLSRLESEIDFHEARLSHLFEERDRLEAMTVEDDYFEFLAEQECER